IYKQLCNPLTQHSNLAEVMTKEKEIVKSEIDERNANHGWVTYYALLDIILEKSNPLLSTILGTDETLQNISEHDLEKIGSDVFVSENLTITVMNHGKKDLALLVREALLELFQSYPRSKKIHKLDWPALDKIKKIKPTESVVYKKTALKNGICSVVFCWIIDFNEFSSEEFGLKRFLHFLNEKVHKYSRNNGLAYSAGAYSIYGETKQFVIIRFDVSKKRAEDLVIILKQLKKDLPYIMNFSSDELRSIIEIEQKRERVVPLSSETRLSWMIYGLQRHQKLVNADRVKEQYKQITENHISQWGSYFTKNQGFTMVVGDIEEPVSSS
ncbi:MAG: hypothetical protein ABIO02_04310, partial [Patescibacteria group bacterium]